MIPKKLSIRDEIYYINNKVSFNNQFGVLLPRDIEASFNFAYDMAIEDYHRHIRSGGSYHRSFFEIFADTFNGKLGEFAVYEYFNSMKNYTCSSPDCNLYSRCAWDDGDAYITNIRDNSVRHVAIKTTKHFGNLLLLETKDWDDTGLYLPSLRNKKLFRPDRFLFVRIKPYVVGKDIESLLYYDNFYGLKRYIEDLYKDNGWHYDIVGYITNKQFIYLMENNYVLPKGAYLKTTKMDAENYYIQAGDLKNIC